MVEMAVVEAAEIRWGGRMVLRYLAEIIES